MTIKDMRKGRGLSQEQAAEALGVKQSYYSRIERGEANPTVGKLVKLARLYEEEEGKLIGEFIRSAEAKGKRCFLPFARALAEYLHVVLPPANHTPATHRFPVTAAA